jgi:GTPase
VAIGRRDDPDAAEELRQLIESAGIQPAGRVAVRRDRPDPALYIGSGKVEEIKAQAQAAGAGFVVFDVALSPAQQRNLERALDLWVLDRTALILYIFSRRAKSREGKLQVELAQLEHLSTRLVRGWSHLERQRGGLGKTGGPGEKQIELDRRMIGVRVRQLRDRLKQLEKQRRTRRRARSRRDVLSVSLVGYTNAGKSTLFNALTRAGAYAADQLFATLDTTSRRVHIGDDVEAVLSDTVGFIRGLPHQLRRPRPICCCTSSTPRRRRARSRWRKSIACWRRSARPTSRGSSSSTRSIWPTVNRESFGTPVIRSNRSR